MKGARIRVFLPVLLLLALAGCGGSVLPQIHSEPERLEVAKRMVDHKEYIQAIELLKSLPDEDSRARAHVYMEGLAEMAREWDRSKRKKR